MEAQELITGSHYLGLNLFGLEIRISETVVVGWILIIVIGIILKLLTHDLKKIPTGKRQVIAEWIVTTVNSLVKETMGEKNIAFAPYIAALFMSSIMGSLVGLFGLRPITSNYNTTIAWALVTFVMVQFFSIRTKGLKLHLKSYINPLNIIGDLALPVSMSFRHFGNVSSGFIISAILYMALSALSGAIGLPAPLTTVGIPGFLSLYFDLFSGFMQAFVFIMLTMAFVGAATEE
ncbi:MAG: F0F1 ATP synthase subunit A [Oscillospiraceae bacterium]|jgi:F-type H+-transporting ATPase subunit a|nr:F0F1 ATP synthase subunit A [Oscillospiraceae bacterium]